MHQALQAFFRGHHPPRQPVGTTALNGIKVGLHPLELLGGHARALPLGALLLRPNGIHPGQGIGLTGADDHTVVEGLQPLRQCVLGNAVGPGRLVRKAAPDHGHCRNSAASHGVGGPGVARYEEGNTLMLSGALYPTAVGERTSHDTEGNAERHDHRPVRVEVDAITVSHVKILMVPPRYGSTLVGGAENLMGALAREAARRGMHVEVATTCAASNETWRNELPAGTSHEDGLAVHRFPVTPRDDVRHAQLLARLHAVGTLSALDEADLMATSVWSEELQRFIDSRGPGFDAIIFTPYLFGTTFWGAQAWPERSFIIPCLHDEPHAHLPSVQKVLTSVRGLMFNAPGEQRLAQRLLGQVGGSVVGMGFTPPEEPADATFASRHRLDRYVVYAGRLEQGKRVDVAARYVAEFAQHHDPHLRLVLIGRGSWHPDPATAPFVVNLGFLPDDEKRAALAGGVALINPSELESLSIVLLEAWLEGTPGLVASGSEVMADHCEQSGGGWPFSDQATFNTALSQLLDDPATAESAGQRGRDYVRSRYSWDEVMRRFDLALDAR